MCQKTLVHFQQHFWFFSGWDVPSAVTWTLKVSVYARTPASPPCWLSCPPDAEDLRVVSTACQTIHKTQGCADRMACHPWARLKQQVSSLGQSKPSQRMLLSSQGQRHGHCWERADNKILQPLLHFAWSGYRCSRTPPVTSSY